MSSEPEPLVVRPRPKQADSGITAADAPAPNAPAPAPSGQTQITSLSESLVSKLPIGRFATVGTGEIGPADDVSSTGTHEVVRSTASNTQATPAAGSAPPMQDENMASLHVKFSASTRFNNSDQDTLRDHIQRLRATGGAQHPSGIPRSGTMRPSSAGSGPRSSSPPLSRRSTNNSSGGSPPSDGSPMSNIMRALAGRHRRSTSADTTIVRRTSSSGQRGSFIRRSNSPPADGMRSQGSISSGRPSSGRPSPSGPVAIYSSGQYPNDGGSGSDTGRRPRERHRLGARRSRSGGESGSDGGGGRGSRGRRPQRSMSRQGSARRGGLFGAAAAQDDGVPGGGEERTSVGRSFSFVAPSMRRSRSSGGGSDQGRQWSRRSRGGGGEGGGGGFAAFFRGPSRSRSRGRAGEEGAGAQPTRRSESRRRRGDSSGGGFFSALIGSRSRARRSAGVDGTGEADLASSTGRGRGRREPSSSGGAFLRALTGRRSTAESVASPERPRRSERRSAARRRTQEQSEDGGAVDGGGGVAGFLRGLTRSRSRGRRSTDATQVGLGSTRRSRERSSGGGGFLRALTRSRSRSRGGAEGSEGEGTGELRRSRTERRNRSAERRSQSRSRSRDPGQSMASAFSFGQRRSRSPRRTSETDLEESGGMRRSRSSRGGGGGLFGRRSRTSRSGRPSLAGQSSGAVMIGSPRGAGGGYGGGDLSGGGAGPAGQPPPYGYERDQSLAFRASGMADPYDLQTPTLRVPAPGVPPGGRPPLAPLLGPSGPSGSQLDAMRPPELQLETSTSRRPLPFVPRVSLTGGGLSSTNTIVPYASFGGTSSLPSPSMAQSPTFVVDRTSLPAVPQPPPARTGSPPRVPGSMRRQGSPERRPPRSASRPRRSESAPRSRAAARRAEMQAAGDGSRQHRSRSARRHDEGEPKVRMSFAAARRARKMSVGGAASGSEAGVDAASEAGMAKSGSARQRGSLFAWLFSGRKSKAAGSVASSPERSMAPAAAAPGTPAYAPPGGASSVPGTPPGPLLGPGPMISPVQGSATGFGGGSMPSYPSTPGSVTRSTSAVVMAGDRVGATGGALDLGATGAAASVAAAAAAIAAAPDVYALAGPRPDGGMVVPSRDPSRRSSGLHRLRPAPLMIPSDPRLGVITAERAAAEAAAAAAAAAAGAKPAEGEGAKKGSWGKLGKMFGAIKRFASPSKGGAAEAQPAAAPGAGAAAGPAVPGTNPLNISTSLLPRPAFPNMQAAGADARTTSQTSVGPDAALSRYRSPDAAAATAATASAVQGLERKDAGGEATADGSVLKERPSKGGKGTGMRRGGGSRGDLAGLGVPDGMVDMHSPFMKAARILQGLGADLEAQDAAKTGKGGLGRHARSKSAGQGGGRAASWSPPKLRAPAFVPRGRSISPLGRGMVADVAAGSPSPGRGPPVVYLAPLAAQVQGRVVISPLKPSQSALRGPGGLALAGHAGGAAWGVDGQGVVLGYDRLPTIVSSLRPGGNNRAVSPPGHLPRPPPPHPGLPYAGHQLPPPTALHTSIDGWVFPSTMQLDPTFAALDPRVPLGNTYTSDQMLLGSLALGATGGTSRRPGTAATVGGGFGGSGGGGGTIAATGRSGRLLSGAQAAFLNAQTQILQQSQLLAATHARAQAQAPWDGALNGGGAGSFTGGLRGSQEVPVGVLRSPRLLGLQEPGVGGMLLQAPDGFRAVVGAEAADWLAAAETGVLPLSRSGAGPGGRTAWVEAAGEEVLLTTAALRPPPRLPRPGLLHLGLASGGPGEPGFGTGSWRGGFGTDGVMSSAAGTLQDFRTMSRPGSAVPGPVRSESPARMPPSAFRPHRPLGTQPPEEAAYTALRRPDQPALLAPDYPYATAEYGASLLPLPPMPGNGMRTGGVLQPRAGTQPFAGAGGGGAATASWRRGTAAAGGGLPPGLAGMGGGRGEDDDSSIASSETANSLRDMPPALALELRRREILDPSGMGLGLPTSGVSGVTVRPLRREVTTGPHVKLMKPKQLLRQLEPPGPEPTFTRRQQWTLTERHGQEAEGTPAQSGRDGEDEAGQEATGSAAAAPDAVQRATEDDDEEDGVVGAVSDEEGAAPPVASRHPSQRSRTSAPGEASTGPERQASHSQSSRRSRHRQDRSSPQPRPEAARAQSPAPGLAPPEAAGWAPDGAAPFIRVDTAATMVRPLAPPPMPAGGRSPPRLLRVPQPPAAYQQTRRHVNFALGGGVGASEEPRFNNVRLMRVVNPPAREAEARPGERAPEQLPSRKLRVLDRPEAEIPGVVPAGTAGRTEHLLGMLRRPEQRRPATGIGHRVGLFEQPPGFGTPGGSPHGGVASASPTPPGHSPRDAATQSGPASPAIEIRVNSSTSPARPAASPRQQASYGDGGYPPYLPYPPPPSAPPPPQIVVAPTDPAALAGLAALQQLSALSALSGLGQAVGVPPVDDPTLWPDLTETTPESLQETVAQTVAAGRLRQQRALSQPNISVAQLRDMDPALVLEPPQMLGPGPLGDAQHMLRTTGVASGPTVVNLPAGPGAGFGAGAGYGGGFGTGGPAGAAGAGGRRSAAAYAPAGASRHDGHEGRGSPGSPGRWLLSRSADGQVLSVGVAVHETGRVPGRRSPGEVVVYGGYQTQHLKSDLEPEPSAASLRERERRRRRGLPVEEEEDEEGGLGRAEEEKGVLPRRGGRSGGVSGGRKGRSNWKDKSGKKHHRRRKGRDAADSASNSESGSSTDHSSTSSRSDSETASSSSSSSSDGRRHSRRRRRKEKEKKKKHKKGKKAVAPDADDSHHEKGGMAPGAAADAAGKHSSAVEAAAGKAAGAKGAGLPPLGPGRTCSSASLPPIGAGGAAPASGSAAAAAGESEAAAARPEPGDDFGMGLAEKLLRQMEEPLKRVGSKAGSKAGSRAGSVKADGMEGREAQGAAGEEGAQADSDELLSPPAGRLARVFAPTSPGAVDQRESNSPNAKMVDVLHGADTERRTQEILDQHAALRAKFIVAADNLRSAVTAAGLPQSQLALGAGNSQPAGSQQQDLPAEPTLTVVAPGEQQQQQQQADAGAAGTGSAAGAVARQDSWQFARGPGSAAGGSAKGSDGGTSASGSVAPSSHATGLEGGAGAGPGPSGPPGSQSINIYCTQLVLNPGSGPVTVPGLPAYYPAPGPAAWGGVPVAQPVMPPPGMPADWEPTADRAGYVRHSPYHPSHPRAYPPAVRVSPTSTAAWLPQQSGGPGAGGGPRSTGGGPPPDRVHSHVHFTDLPPSISAYSPPEHKSGDSADSSPDGPSAPGGRLYSGASQASLAARSQGGAGFALRPEASGVSQSSRQPPIARVISRGSSIARAWGAASLGGPEPSIGSMQRLTEERLAGLAVGSDGGAGARGGGSRRHRSSAASGPMSVEEEPTAVGSERGELEVVEEAAAGESGRVPSAEASSHAASDRAGSGSGEAALAATAAGRQQGDERGSGSGSQGSGAAATATSTAAAATATGGMLQPQDTKTQLAVELTQLIMEAFQQSGGVITAHREPGGSGDGADGAAAAGNRVGGGKVDKAVGTSAAGGSSRTGRGPGSAASGRSGSLGGFEATLSAPPSAEPVPPPQPPPMRLPATLPNAGVPRGAGPNFLQVRDIALAADAPPGPTQFTPDPATDKLTADILGGLNNWKETVMSALMGRPPPPPQPPAQLQPPAPVLQPGAGGGGAGLAAAHTVTLYDMPVVMQGQYHSPGPGQGPAAAGRPPAYLTGGQQPDPGRDLTAAEALVLEPGYAMQHSMAAIATRKQQRAAAVEERRARYAAGMDAFAADGHQPQPLHMPPPQHPWPPPGGQDYRPAPGPGTVGYGAAGVTNPATLHGWAAAGAPTFAGGASGIQRRYGGGGGTSGAVAGGRGSPLALDEDTHGTMFPQSQYAGGLAGPGVARQPHPRSPLQRVMHGEADPRKKRRAWEVPTVEQQRAAPLWEHQATFRTNVRTAMRSAGRRERTARPSPGREHGSGHEGSYHYTGSLPGRASVGVGPPTVSFADGTRGGYSPQEGDARVPYMARASHPANASPATAAVRSLATMVARRFDDGQWETRQLQKLGEGRGRGGGGGEEGGWEEDAEGVWPGDADVLGDSNVCGGCDFPGCPVHGDPGAAAAAEEERQSRRRPPGAQPGGPDAQAYTEQELTKRAHRDMARSVMLDQWMAEMKQLSAATAKAEATRKVAIASAQQAVANRRERQAAELAGIFDMLTEVDALANNISDQAGETRKMMQVLEEEAELRRVSRLNSLLHEARRLGSAVDTALGPEDKAAAGTGGEVDGGAAAASSGG